MKVTIIAAHRNINFTSKNDGREISGDKLYYTRQATAREIERGWACGVVLEDKFISTSSKIKIPENLPIPCEAELLYECVGRYNELLEIDFLIP